MERGISILRYDNPEIWWKLSEVAVYLDIYKHKKTLDEKAEREIRRLSTIFDVSNPQALKDLPTSIALAQFFSVKKKEEVPAKLNEMSGRLFNYQYLPDQELELLADNCIKMANTLQAQYHFLHGNSHPFRRDFVSSAT